MKKQKLIMILSLVAFFLVILFPLWGWFFPQAEKSALEENRSLTDLNFSGTLKNRIRTFEEYLNDHLAFREAAIVAVLRANLDLGESPHPSVLSGFEGWLYYREGGEDFRHGSGLDEKMLRTLYDVQQQITDTFAEAGIDYRILIAPDKHSIYPQYLPLSSRLGTGISALDQMMTAPEAKYSVRFVDVRPALIAAAEMEGQQYYKTDTHWNACGAFTAYQALMDALLEDHPTLHKLTEADVVRTEITASGDLAAMIGQKGLREDHCGSVSVRNPVSKEDPDHSDNALTAFRNEAIPDAPRMLLIHDSFGPALMPFLRESVSELYTLSNDSPSFSAIGDLSRFDIVVMEVVERKRSWLWSGIDNDSGLAQEEYYE